MYYLLLENVSLVIGGYLTSEKKYIYKWNLNIYKKNDKFY